MVSALTADIPLPERMQRVLVAKTDGVPLFIEELTRMVVDMEADSGVATEELRVDGGAALNDWLMGFQADVLGVPVRRPANVETTALGAAGLAGVHSGVWSSGDDFLARQGEAVRFEPTSTAERREALLAGWHRAVRAAVAWAQDG